MVSLLSVQVNRKEIEMLKLDLRTIANIIGGEIVCPASIDKENALDSCICGVDINSKNIQEGYVFFASKGESFDAHNVIDDVFDKGALAVVCERIPESQKAQGVCIIVPNSKLALRAVAKYYREMLGDKLKVVAITGSVGKTSTKEFVANVVAQKYKTHKTFGNRNSITMFPMEVMSIEEDEEVAILEIGIDRKYEMDQLSEMAQPDIAVITNIGKCHIKALESLDGVLAEKSKIWNCLKDGGKVVLNGDDDKLALVGDVNGVQPYRVGKSTQNVYVSKVKNKSLDGTEVEISIDMDGNKESFQCRINIPGQHMIENALIATAIGKLLGIETELIKKGIESTMPMDKRSNIIKTSKYTIINDCYNANPMSVKAALDMLVLGNGRKVAILGDMLDLGEESMDSHKKIGEYAADKHIELMIFAGKEAAYMRDGATSGIVCEGQDIRYYEDKEDLYGDLDKLLMEGDTILVKASRSVHFEEITKRLL